MILSSLKKVSIATVGATALALGMSSAALAGPATVTAVTSGIDSGFDSVAEQIQNDPAVLAFLNVQLPAIATQLGGTTTLRNILQAPGTIPAIASFDADLAASLENLATIDAPQVNGVLDDPFDLDAIAAALPVLLNSETPDDFFTVSFNAGPLDAFVESITFDLGVDVDAAFDNRDFFFYNASPEVGQLNGLTAGDISFSTVTRNDFDNPNPTTSLTVSFAEGSFGLGDWFTFGVDTNAVGNDSIPQLSLFNALTNDELSTLNDAGDDFGEAGVTFSVNFENGKSGEGTFAVAGGVPLTSIAQASVDVPEPGSAAALIAVVAAAAKFGKRKEDQ